MSIPLEAIVGDLYIVGGARQPVSAPTAMFQPPRRAARGRVGDRLFVLVELRRSDLGADSAIAYGSSAPYGQIIDQAAAAYWNTPGSITAALRAAITAANNWLMDRNLESPVPERLGAGITCVVMRAADVFVAQAGPAACYVAHQGQVERFPSRDVSSPALGASRGVEVRYGHADLHPGDVVLLCDSLTADRVPDETIAGAVVYVGVPAALANLERLAGTGNLIALVIEGAPAGAPIRAEPAPAPSPAPKPPPPVVAPEPLGPEGVPEIVRPRERGPSLRDRLSDTWSRLRRRFASTGQAVPRAALADRARQVVRSVLAGLMAARHATQVLSQSMLPDRAAWPQRSAPGSTLIGAGLFILVSLLVPTMVVYQYTQHRRQVEFDSLLALARVEATGAPATLDERDARARWQLAWQHARELLTRQPGHPDAQVIHDQALAQLDRMDRVTRVKAVLLSDFGAGAGYRLAAQGMNVFVMDSRRIWLVTLNETGASVLENATPPVSAYSGETISGRQVGDLFDLTWVSADGLRTKSSLLILDAQGLLEYDPAWNIRAVPLGQGETRPGLRLVAAFGGNLYVMDNSQLWRYKPVGDGYSAPPEAYFNASPGDLSAVIDLAIDGSVYLLYADGRIRKFFGGEEQPFTPTDLPDPLARPVALAADPEATRGSLYVADAGRQSIVQFTPQGIFIRQVKAYDDAMAALESLFVDERAQRLYFLSGGKLYAVSLPAAHTP